VLVTRVLESDLSKPVSDWLAAKGYVPYAEVAFPRDSARTIDIVARKDNELILVELKVSLTPSVISQTFMCDLITSQRYAAVGTRPTRKGIDRCRQVGIGLLSVRDGRVNVLLHPQITDDMGQGWVREDYSRLIHETLDRMTPNGIGGVPCMKGVGPAQECYDRVQAYKAGHPKATWREIFANVSNHYSSYANMYSGMRFVAERRAKARNIADFQTQQTGKLDVLSSESKLAE